LPEGVLAEERLALLRAPELRAALAQSHHLLADDARAGCPLALGALEASRGHRVRELVVVPCAPANHVHVAVASSTKRRDHWHRRRGRRRRSARLGQIVWHHGLLAGR